MSEKKHHTDNGFVLTTDELTVLITEKFQRLYEQVQTNKEIDSKIGNVLHY